MDNFNNRREKEFRLGLVARAVPHEQDLFALTIDPLRLARSIRLPSGPAILLPDAPLVQNRREDDLDLERWDGLA